MVGRFHDDMPTGKCGWCGVEIYVQLTNPDPMCSECKTSYDSTCQECGATGLGEMFGFVHECNPPSAEEAEVRITARGYYMRDFLREGLAWELYRSGPILDLRIGTGSQAEPGSA